MSSNAGNVLSAENTEAQPTRSATSATHPCSKSAPESGSAASMTDGLKAADALLRSPDPVVERVLDSYGQLMSETLVDLWRKRSSAGMVKFGISMEDNDQTAIYWFKNAREEALDLANYLEKCKSVSPEHTKMFQMRQWDAVWCAIQLDKLITELSNGAT